MTTFTDGPAKGQNLPLRRSPFLLRVVVNTQGKWDALDELRDTPADNERIFAYRLISEPMRGFWDGKGKGGQRTGGAFVFAQYRLVENQPHDAAMRDTQNWRAWTVAERDRINRQEPHPDR